jgi:signal transduction histidine kinase
MLVNKSRDAYLNQKEFTENASHELQTPIAIFRSKLELLIQTTPLTKEQAELISNLLDTTDRIARLNKNLLLLLSKIENRQFISTDEVSVLAVLNRTIEDYQQLAFTREINITVDAAKDLVIKANPILFEILISNLISNALRYATFKTDVWIKVEKETLTVLNNGSPLKSPEKIFNRFNQESRSSQGSGLGLAILKKICEVENFSINYYYSNSRHQFQVSFSANSSESIQN